MNTRVGHLPSASFASLFCGCGGLDLGLSKAGLTCVAAYDIDPVVVSVHRSNLKSPAEVCDLSTLSKAGVPFIHADVIVAGSPCQGFSTVGKRRLDDPRNQLLLLAGRIAVSSKPKVFVAENVRGVLSGEHKIYWDRLRKMLESAGFQTKDLLLEGTRLGLSQIRKRVVMVAWLKPCGFQPGMPDAGGRTLRGVLSAIDGVPNHEKQWLTRNSDPWLIASHIQPGQKLSNVRGGPRSVHTWDIPEVFGHVSESEKEVLCSLMYMRRRYRARANGDADPVPRRILRQALGSESSQLVNRLIRKGFVRSFGNAVDLTHTFNGKFRRLSWNEPSLTVDTRFGNPKYFLHPDENRGFTVREAARIQGFPDWFVFDGPGKKQYEMIGNAVPPPMAEALGKLIEPLL